MTNDEIYDFIGELAIALYSKKIQISLGSLRAIMLDKGKDYVNNRGMASAVSAAYRRWKVKDPVIYYAIAYTYTDREGNLAWDEPNKNSTIVEKQADPVEEVKEEKLEEVAVSDAPEVEDIESSVMEEETPQEDAEPEVVEEKVEAKKTPSKKSGGSAKKTSKKK